MNNDSKSSLNVEPIGAKPDCFKLGLLYIRRPCEK